MSKRAHKASSAIVSPVNYPGWDTGRVYSDNSPSYAPIGGYPRSPLNHLPSPSPGREMRSPSEQPPLRYSKTSPSFTPIGSYVYPSAPLNRSPSPSYMPTEPNEEAQDYEDHRRQEDAKRPTNHARIHADFVKLVPKVIEAELDLEIPEPYAGGWRQLGLDIQKQIELDEAEIEELAERLRKRKNAKEAVVAFNKAHRS